MRSTFAFFFEGGNWLKARRTRQQNWTALISLGRLSLQPLGKPSINRQAIAIRIIFISEPSSNLVPTRNALGRYDQQCSSFDTGSGLHQFKNIASSWTCALDGVVLRLESSFKERNDKTTLKLW